MSDIIKISVGDSAGNNGVFSVDMEKLEMKESLVAMSCIALLRSGYSHSEIQDSFDSLDEQSIGVAFATLMNAYILDSRKKADEAMQKAIKG